MRKVEAILDQALATSFDSHVIAGYKFVMRHYRRGDRIYIFGFSRGAYTARFLARMISHVGLLSIGNDEMVPFAYKVYEEYERYGDDTPERREHKKSMNSFKQYFCRTEQSKAGGVKVHFLGLFDCVSSVGNLDVPFFQKAAPLPAARETADHVRHAVAIDERRVKSKAALFAQEVPNGNEHIKEVWFPGNHGDVGGGWDIVHEGVCADSTGENARLLGNGQEIENNRNIDHNRDVQYDQDFEFNRNGEYNHDMQYDQDVENNHDVETNKGVETDHDVKHDHFQLSDVALKWMIDEIQDVDKGNENRIAWDKTTKDSFYSRFEQHKHEMQGAKIHDTMKYDKDSNKNVFMILLWNIMGKLARLEPRPFPTNNCVQQNTYHGSSNAGSSSKRTSGQTSRRTSKRTLRRMPRPNLAAHLESTNGSTLAGHPTWAGVAISPPPRSFTPQ